jgi:heme o synthase
VKFKLVTDSSAPLRAFVMGLHVISTFALLGSIAAAALAASGARKIQLRNQGFAGYLLWVGCLGMLFLGVTGAISAFGHQVNPDVHGLAAMTDPKAFWASRLAVSHPYGSASVGLYLFLMCGMIRHLRPDPFVHKSALLVMGMLVVQMLVGVSNIWLKAPIPMQMIHLVIADLNWVSMVTLVIAACGVGIEHVEFRPAPQGVIQPDQVLRGKALVKAYIGLTKPRIISLLLFTTLTAAIAAKGSWPGITLFSIIAVAGYMAAGAANAINMVIDRDIDIVMKRTASRPTVTQSIPSTHVLTFAFALAGLSFSLLWGFANLLSALMAMSGLVFYVVIYTMLLKRRTWQNIVIGGAAGAFPPLVGWAAITNDLPPLAIYLFAIVFVWTPVHFWALALLLKDEYEAAGVPMLPNVKGDSYTVKQIAFYTVITIVVTLAPMLLPQVGWIYGASAVALNAVLVWKLSKLMKVVDRPQASGLFHYSMIYLAILFFMLAVDRVVIL